MRLIFPWPSIWAPLRKKRCNLPVWARSKNPCHSPSKGQSALPATKTWARGARLSLASQRAAAGMGERVPQAAHSPSRTSRARAPIITSSPQVSLSIIFGFWTGMASGRRPLANFPHLLPRPPHQHLGADAAHHEVIGEGGGQPAEGPEAGAVAGHDQFRVDFPESLDGILDKLIPPGGEVEASQDEGDLIHSGEFLRVLYYVDDARVAAAADDHQAPALHPGHQGLLVGEGVGLLFALEQTFEDRQALFIKGGGLHRAGEQELIQYQFRALVLVNLDSGGLQLLHFQAPGANA